MSKIEWTDETWNPVTGCTKISEGCANCYAERMARRLAGRYGYPETPRHFDVTLHPERLEQPLRWRKPRTVFVCSMGDLFHEDVPADFIHNVFVTMWNAKQHIFQVLTKRPKRMHDTVRSFLAQVGAEMGANSGIKFPAWPASNIWLGVTAENQVAANERIPLLLQAPAAVRFISFEPLLDDVAAGFQQGAGIERIDWCIVGGESGHNARPMHPDWVRALREFALCWGIPFFFKQWGEWLWIHPDRESWEFNKPPSKVCQLDDMRFYKVGKKAAGRLLDGREWNEFPVE